MQHSTFILAKQNKLFRFQHFLYMAGRVDSMRNKPTSEIGYEKNFKIVDNGA